MHMNLSNLLGLKDPALKYINFLSSRVQLSYKPISYKDVYNYREVLGRWENLSCAFAYQARSQEGA